MIIIYVCHIQSSVSSGSKPDSLESTIVYNDWIRLRQICIWKCTVEKKQIIWTYLNTNSHSYITWVLFLTSYNIPHSRVLFSMYSEVIWSSLGISTENQMTNYRCVTKMHGLDYHSHAIKSKCTFLITVKAACCLFVCDYVLAIYVQWAYLSVWN